MRALGEDLAEAVEVEDAGEGFFLDDGVGEGGFVALEGEDFLLHGVGGDEPVGDDGLGLADAMRAVDGLSFDGRIPPRIAEDNVAGGGEVEAGAGGFEREEENRFGAIALELIDEFSAVFGGAGELEVTDVGSLEARLDEFEQGDELAENEHLLAFVAEFFKALEEGVEFGAGDFAVGPGDERGVAADLAEAQEAGEDVEAHGVEGAGGFDAEELGAGAFELGVVEGALFAVEIDEDDVFGARRQLGGDLGLGAAQHEVADAAAETSSGGRVFGRILAAETGLGAEEAGLRKGEEAPEIKETIFDGRAGERDAVRGGDGARDGGGLARRVFDELSFVENDRIPVVAVKPRGVQAELSVVDDEQGAAIRGAGHFGAVGNERREDFSGEFGRETFGLGEPAVHHALGADDDSAKRFFIGAARLSGGVGVGLVQEPGEGLHGFTETHVVGQNTAEAAGREVREKLKPFFLIRAQGGAQAGGKRRGGNRGEGGGALAERVGEGGVFGGEGIDLGDELERVQPVFRGFAGGEHVFGAEAETVEGSFGAVVGGRGELEASPTVVGQADPFAARLEEQGEFVGLERGVFDAEFDGEVEPVAAFAGGGCGGKFHMTL